jgi:hypothetical protein
MPRGNQLARQWLHALARGARAGRNAPPYKGGVYDPCCGSDGMFVQSEKFIEDRASLLFAYT